MSGGVGEFKEDRMEEGGGDWGVGVVILGFEVLEGREGGV